MKQAGEASEDEIERAKKRAEELVADAGQKVDQIIQGKEKDILAI
jgi:ribosome recycling factor